MPNDREQKSASFDELIELAANEGVASVESAQAIVAEPSPLMNHPSTAVVAWLFLLMLSAMFYLNPLASQNDIGVRGTDTRLRVAMYHIAHRVEHYRDTTGKLPDFVDPSWSESRKVEYRLVAGRYELAGKDGELEVIYREGENPEELLNSSVSPTGPSS